MKTNQKIKVEKVWDSFLGRYFYPNSLGSCLNNSVSDVSQDTEISGSDVEATPNKVYESPYDDRDVKD